MALLVLYFADSVSSFRCQTDVFSFRKNFNSHLMSYTIYIIINSKWTMDLNIKAKCIKLLGENEKEKTKNSLRACSSQRFLRLCVSSYTF